ncbi:MAG: serine/threonine protein kinase [Saprospiraceae bacterium]|nr:serine/threonine protein kinase [Saprospiraceae bacterium]
MNWEKVSELFEEATEKTAGAEREAYLKEIAQEYPNEYQEVKTLLEAEEDLIPMLRPDSTNLWETIYDLAWEGRVIGNYQLVNHLGSGGMGAVLLAKRIDGEFDQTVAMKVLRPGVWSDRLADRFREERQILANLQHPNIARLLDGGVGADGTPYFTMEYVDGEPITDYCENQDLNIKDKLNLILQVCKAIDYAHKNLIIHLDLKPSNILVNSEGQVKLLDFGIAQALQNSEGIESQFFTQQYASPEQINKEKLTTASDIYSLGIILQELLPKLNKIKIPFSNDLVAIIKKTTQVKPQDRYASASEIARDIEFYLSNYPVSAHPRTPGYLLRKGFRRNRVLVSAALIALLTIISITIFYTARLQKEKSLAEQEATKAKQISDYLINIFTLADPNETPASEFTVQQLLDASTKDVNEKLKDQPEVLSDIYDALSAVYHGLGLYESADSLSQLGLNLKFNLYKPPHEDIINSLVNAAAIALDGGYFEKADSLYRSAYQMTLQLPGDQELTIAKRQYDLGMLAYNDEDFTQADSLYKIAYHVFQKHYKSPRFELADALHIIGATQRKLGNYDASEDFYLQSLKMKQELYTAPHAEIAYTLNHLASLYYDQENYIKAIPYAKESLSQRQQVFGFVNMEAIASQANLARIYSNSGNLDSAAILYKDAIERCEKVYGESHHNLAGLINSLANVYLDKKDFAQAENYYRRAYSIGEQLLPSDHPNLAIIAGGLGLTLYRQNHYAAALPYLQKVVKIRQQSNIPDKTPLGISQYYMGTCLYKMGRTTEARPILEESRTILSENAEKYNKELQEINAILH